MDELGSVSVSVLKSVPQTVAGPPTPTAPNDAALGLALSQASSSFRSFGGRPLRPMNSIGAVVSMATGAKSFSTS